jgi:hypothetical protein
VGLSAYLRRGYARTVSLAHNASAHADRFALVGVKDNLVEVEIAGGPKAHLETM